METNSNVFVCHPVAGIETRHMFGPPVRSICVDLPVCRANKTSNRNRARREIALQRNICVLTERMDFVAPLDNLRELMCCGRISSHYSVCVCVLSREKWPPQCYQNAFTIRDGVKMGNRNGHKVHNSWLLCQIGSFFLSLSLCLLTGIHTQFAYVPCWGGYLAMVLVWWHVWTCLLCIGGMDCALGEWWWQRHWRFLPYDEMCVCGDKEFKTIEMAQEKKINKNK